MSSFKYKEGGEMGVGEGREEHKSNHVNTYHTQQSQFWLLLELARIN